MGFVFLLPKRYCPGLHPSLSSLMGLRKKGMMGRQWWRKGDGEGIGFVVGDEDALV